ncbi:1-(5-phosphoribosyl)-5-[(5-phosphoribosylamino)methylideneamino] imidazole-4-carboxamide isomerase [Synergistaceae bacterium OttesenSCG-928-D05]|nr:1-(5-phosphoribosyl)-5-[(5-phosphoribosylamino)methylideneamino] imidazole-4-carboxamide isomerase [Synergistaceae bacterium OttesenSCG-928-D05]
MILFPAIDLYEGKVIRLQEGNFNKKTSYDASPLETAKRYRDAGCTHIHVVDLEGAKIGVPRHLGVLEEIASLGMFVQYGGGLRSIESIRAAAESGANRVMAGSLLFQDPGMPALLYEIFGRLVMPAIDVKEGRVVYAGWLARTGESAREVIARLRGAGYSCFLVTDTERDGMLQGFRRDFYAPLLGPGYQIVAAGGVTTADDIAALAAEGLSAAVVGKSLYEGRLTIEDALAAASGCVYESA